MRAGDLVREVVKEEYQDSVEVIGVQTVKAGGEEKDHWFRIHIDEKLEELPDINNMQVAFVFKGDLSPREEEMREGVYG